MSDGMFWLANPNLFKELSWTHDLKVWLMVECLSFVQDALASFDFLNRRNSMAVKTELDHLVDQELQQPELELSALQQDNQLR